MFRHFLKSAVRQAVRHRLITTINIVGLAVGLGVFFMILKIILFELSFDTYHNNVQNMYRLISKSAFEGPNRYGSEVPYYFGRDLADNLPEIMNVTRIIQPDELLLQYSLKMPKVELSKSCFANPSLFDFFQINVISGNPEHWLINPGEVIISEKIAGQYFAGRNPVGEIFTIHSPKNKYDVKIEGVFENLPENSELKWDVIVSNLTLIPDNSFSDEHCITLFELSPETSIQGLIAKISDYANTAYDENNWLKTNLYSLQPLSKMHLDSRTTDQNRIRRLTILGLVGMLILCIAVVNTIILNTTKDTERFKNAGIKKVIGAEGRHLVGQALTEAFVYVLIASPIALAVAETGLPRFTHYLYNEPLHIVHKMGFVLSIIGLSALTACLTGLGFSLLVSRMNPVFILKGSLRSGRSRTFFRGILILIQLSIFTGLLVSSLIIRQQIQYLHSKNLGFNEAFLIRLELPQDGKAQSSALINALSRHNSIAHVSGAAYFPTAKKQAIHASIAPDEKNGGYKITELTEVLGVDYGFMKTLDLKLVDGRNFSTNFPGDASDKIIVNERIIKEKQITNPIGKSYSLSGKDHQIIGVVQDFHFRSLHEKINPMVLSLETVNHGEIACRISPDNISSTLEFIQKTWKSVFPNDVCQYFFVDEVVGKYYRAEQQFSQIIGIATALSILIAGMGLFGLALQTSRQRIKEIGIRKVLGASTPGIVTLLSKEFLKWILIANMIAMPIAYYLMQKWLENFVYRTEIHWTIFMSALLSAGIVTFLTVGFQAARVAKANPVEALRYE